MKIKFIDETRTTLTDYCKETIEKRISSKLDIFEDVINDIVIKISRDKKKVFLLIKIYLMQLRMPEIKFTFRLIKLEKRLLKNQV